jgi:hypothetical protein
MTSALYLGTFPCSSFMIFQRINQQQALIILAEQNLNMKNMKMFNLKKKLQTLTCHLQTQTGPLHLKQWFCMNPASF